MDKAHERELRNNLQGFSEETAEAEPPQNVRNSNKANLNNKIY